MPSPQREHTGFTDSAISSIERSIATLYNLKTRPDGPSRKSASAAELSTVTAIVADLLSNLQDLCTVLCIGGEGFMRSFDSAKHVQVLIQCYQTIGVGVDIKILTLRAITLISEGAARGVASVVNAGGISFLLGIITNTDELIASDQLAEEVLKCLQPLAIEANKRVLQANAIILLLNLSQVLGDHIAKSLTFSCLSDIISVIAPDDWDDIKGAFGSLLATLQAHISRLDQVIGAQWLHKNDATTGSRSLSSSLAHEEGSIYKICGCFIHLIDRSCVNEKMCEVILNSSFGEQLVPLALTLFALADKIEPLLSGQHAGGGKAHNKLQRAAVSILTALFVASPRQALKRMTQHALWHSLEDIIVGLVSSTSTSNTMSAMAHGEVGEAQLDVLAALNRPRTTEVAAIPTGLGTGTTVSNVTILAANRALLSSLQVPLEPLVAEEYRMIAMLELLLLITPSAGDNGDGSVDTRSRVTTVHTWQWEDDFRNRTDYEEHVSSALEAEYRAQQVSRQYRSVDITAASRSVSASFEKMRHYTTSGLPLRPLFRVPFISNFYHVRVPCQTQCTCYKEGKATDSPNRYPLPSSAQARPSVIEEVAPDRSTEAKAKKRSGGGFFSGFCGCCTKSAREISPRRGEGKERRQSHRTKSAEPEPPGNTRDQHYFDLECKMFFGAKLEPTTTVALSLVRVAVRAVSRCVNAAVLRHATILLLRGLSLLRSTLDRRSGNPANTTCSDIMEFLQTQKSAVIKSLASLLICCDLEHLERLCASTTNTNENADHAYLARWTGDSEDKCLPFCLSLQGEILMAVLESLQILLSVHRSMAEEMHKEGIHKVLCGALKSLSTLHDSRNCPRHQPTQFIFAELSQLISVSVKGIEGSASPIRFSSGSALFSLLATASPVVPPTVRGPTPIPRQASANSLDDALTAPATNGIDKTCPVAIAPALALLANLRKNNPLSLNDILAGSLSVKTSTFEATCQLCVITSELRAADMTLFQDWQGAQNMSASHISRAGTPRSQVNSHGQTLSELLSSPAGALYRTALEELTIRLVSFISEQVGVAGSCVSDVVGVTRNHKTVKQPVSLVMVCLQQRLSVPISFRLLPIHLPRSQPADRDRDIFIEVGGTQIKCTPVQASTKGIALQAYLFTTVGALVDDLCERYNEAASRRRTIDIDASDMCSVCASNAPYRPFLGRNSIASLHPLIAYARAEGRQAREEAANDTRRRLNLDEEVAPRQSPSSTPPQVELLPNQVDEPVSQATTTGGGQAQINGKCSCPIVNSQVESGRIILLVNGYPLVDRSKRVADVLVAFGPSSPSFGALLDTSGCDPDARQALLRTLGTWGMQHTLQFAILAEPLPPSLLPTADDGGCTCNEAKKEMRMEGHDTPRMQQAVSKYSESNCSPWHIYVTQAGRHHHNLTDDILRLLETLVEIVVTPHSPRLLLDVGRKLYSSVIHSIRFQSLSFVAPAFSFLCHPILNTHNVGDCIAEYALWNYPSIFPIVLRIAVFRQIIVAKRGIIPKGGQSSQGIVGGQWLRHTQGSDSNTRIVRNKVKSTISRDDILGGTKQLLESLATCPLSLDIEFYNEPGSGLGPTCEFFCLAAAEFLKKEMGMWLDTSTQEVTHINGYLYPRYSLEESSLGHFRLLGRLLGRALQDGREVRIPFHEAFAQQIIGNVTPTSLADGQLSEPMNTLSLKLKSIDAQLESSLSHLEELSGEALEGLELYFTFPGIDSLELTPQGSQILVTRFNVAEYCQAVRRHACVTCLTLPTRCILEGMSDAIVPGHLRLFTPSELNLLIGGPPGKVWSTPEELLKNILCDHGYSVQSKAIAFFVSTVVAFSPEEQRLFLKFLSGTDCIPIGGLSPPITIVRKGLNADATPYRRRRRPHPTTSNGATSEGLSVGGGDNISSASEQAPAAVITSFAGVGSSPFAEGEGESPSSFNTPQRVLSEESEVTLTTQEQVDECLPTVNTCFHYLKLPDYSSEEVCRERLLCAIAEGQGVFLLS